MQAHHPTHPIIFPTTRAPARPVAANELAVDFEESGERWRLLISVEPNSDDCGSDRSIKQAEESIAAFEHAVNMRRINLRSANRFANDDEQATFGRWLKAFGDRLLVKSQRLSQYGDAIIADAPTAFRVHCAA